MRLARLGGVLGALFFVLPAASALAATPCTMTNQGSTQFTATTNATTPGQAIHVENVVSTDLTATQHLVLRSVTAPQQYFTLTSLTSASCARNANFPPEEGATHNSFTGNGTGNFGTAFNANSSGYSIHFEIGDWGDGGTPDNTHADTVNFTITKTSTGAVVWSGRGNLTSGAEELAETPVVVAGSCEPSSSLTVLIQGKNVTAYVPKGNWGNPTTGVSTVDVEGSSGITPALIPTPNATNSCAPNPITGVVACTANNTDVYLFKGDTLTNTLTSGSNGSADFSGGACMNCGIAMDAAHNRAVIGMGLTTGPGFQFLDLNTNTFGTPFSSPSGAISEDPLIDPTRNLLLSASENGNYELVNVTNPASPQFFENATGGGTLDSSGEDCSTGIALAPAEFSDPSSVFIADLTKAVFTPGTPAGTWTAPSQNQILSESSLSAGASGIAVAQGTHIGIVSGEFGGDQITAIQLPSTSGTGATPAITDWVSCAIGNGFSNGFDPHTVTAYQSPNSGDAIGLLANDAASQLADVDLTKMLNPADVPRDAGGHACASGTLPSSVLSFFTVS